MEQVCVNCGEPIIEGPSGFWGHKAGHACCGPNQFAAPTAPVQTDLERIQASYTSGGQSYEPAAPVGQPETKQIAYSSSMPHVNCTGPCCRPDLWASGVKGVAAPAAPVGQPDAMSICACGDERRDHGPMMWKELGMRCRSQFNVFRLPGQRTCFDAAPAANALPETDDKISDQRLKELTEAFDDIGTEDLMLDTCANTDGFEIADALRQLAAAQQEIAARLVHEKSQFDEIKVLRKISDEATFELTALRQKYAELLKEIVEARELAKLKEIPSRVTLSRWESAIAHAELLEGKK